VLTLPVLLSLGGCATVHLVGLVHPGDPVTLTTMVGDEFRLGLDEDARPLSYLDGHLAEVDGWKGLRRITVTQWRVLEGLHGLPVYVGILEARGSQVGMHDRTTGSFLLLDQAAAETLRAHVGVTVLVEGYIEGANRVRVVYFRVLGGGP
jgi:hypothetical protein